MSTAYVRYPAVGGSGGGGDVVGPASSPNDPGYAFPVAMFADATGKLLKSYPDVWYWQDGTLTIKDFSIGGTGVISKAAAQLLQYTGYGTYFIKDLINEPASSANIGLLAANGNHYPFITGSMQSVQIGYDAGDASVAVPTGTLKAKTNLAIDAAKTLLTGSLGVGNSAAATTPGSVVKKMEIFDAAGTSLGFVAIYDAIT